MAFYIKKTINGVPKGIPLTTDSGQGLPLGSWTSFEDDQPRNGYLKAGTTFNQSDYPALYAMLGSNIVPEKFDHNRLGDYESITISTSSSSPTVMPYDGFIYSSTVGAVDLYINGVQFLISDHNKTPGGGACMVVVRKGDSVYIARNNSSTERVAYYKHPMFIKAVIGPIEDSAADQVVQNINNSRSYSTEEVNTGEKWIDGKPIYRRTFEVYKNNVLNGWTRKGHTFIYQGNDLSIDELISNSAITSNGILTSWSDGTNDMDYPYGITHSISGSNHEWAIINDSNGQFSGTKCILTIEYTKTTD